MLFHCLKFRRKTESKNPQVRNTSKEKVMLLSKFAVPNSKN